MLNQWTSYSCVWTTCCSNPVFDVKPFFLMSVAFTCHDLQILRTLVIRAQKTADRLNNVNKNVGVRYAVHASCLAGPYYVSNELGREAHFKQMLYSYVRSEAQQLPEKAVFQQDGGLHDISCAVHSLLGDVAEFMDWWMWSSRLASKNTRLALLFFLWEDP